MMKRFLLIFLSIINYSHHCFSSDVFYESKVLETKQVSSFIKEITLTMPEGFSYKVGQYIRVEIPEFEINTSEIELLDTYRSSWEKFGLTKSIIIKNEEPINRFYSISSYSKETNIIKLNIALALPMGDYKNPGVASSYLFSLNVGASIKFKGPYGKFLIEKDDHKVIYLAKGSGLGPIRAQILERLLVLGHTMPITLYYSAHSKADLYYVEELEAIESEFKNFKFIPMLRHSSNVEFNDSSNSFESNIKNGTFNTTFYLCGSDQLVSEANLFLKTLGAHSSQIHYDNFGKNKHQIIQKRKWMQYCQNLWSKIKG